MAYQILSFSYNTLLGKYKKETAMENMKVKVQWNLCPILQRIRVSIDLGDFVSHHFEMRSTCIVLIKCGF